MSVIELIDKYCSIEDRQYEMCRSRETGAEWKGVWINISGLTSEEIMQIIDACKEERFFLQMSTDELKKPRFF